MITKIKSGFYDPRSNYKDYDYIGDEVMINPSQRRTLVELISINFQQEEREDRLRDLDNLTSTEAEDMIFQILSATW